MTNAKEFALVTGGAGFIGSELVIQLLAEGLSVVVLDNLSFGRKENLPNHENLHFVLGDITDLAKVKEVIRKYSPRAVYHLAAIHFIPYCLQHPLECIRVNVEGTTSVLEACKNSSVDRVVYTSTAAVYGIKDSPHIETEAPEPLEIYGASKLFGEHLVRLFHHETQVKCGIIRLFNGYGRRETNPHVIPEILIQLEKSNKIQLGNTDPKRDFIHTSDIARAFRMLAKDDTYRLDTFNVGTGEEHSIVKLVDVISGLLGKKIEIVSDEKRKRKVERYHLVADIGKIRKNIGWEPKMSFENGFEDLLLDVGLLKK